MAVVEALIPVAFRLGRNTFVSEHEGFHLLKPPSAGESEMFGYETLEAEGPEGLPPSHIIPSSTTWQSTRVRKRPGNPYPERISVGRATNCDIVLRFSVVSKLHAHFSWSPRGMLQLYDLGSANGTWHNGRRLHTGEVITLGSRDLISFGGVHCELVDADGLFDLVSGTRH